MDLHPDGVWRGSPTTLYNELSDYAEQNKISIRSKAWPKTAHWMMRRFNEVAPSLVASGYLIEKDRSSKTRVITVRITSENSVHGVTSVIGNDSNDANDGNFSSLPVKRFPTQPTLDTIVGGEASS